MAPRFRGLAPTATHPRPLRGRKAGWPLGSVGLRPRLPILGPFGAEREGGPSVPWACAHGYPSSAPSGPKGRVAPRFRGLAPTAIRLRPLRGREGGWPLGAVSLRPRLFVFGPFGAGVRGPFGATREGRAPRFRGLAPTATHPRPLRGRSPRPLRGHKGGAGPSVPWACAHGYPSSAPSGPKGRGGPLGSVGLRPRLFVFGPLGAGREGGPSGSRGLAPTAIRLRPPRGREGGWPLGSVGLRPRLLVLGPFGAGGPGRVAPQGAKDA